MRAVCHDAGVDGKAVPVGAWPHRTDRRRPLKLPSSIKAAAARLAKEDGVSLNQWIASAVAQKAGAVETAAGFFRRRAGEARPDDLRLLLARAPDRAPDPGDEPPEPPEPSAG